MVRLTHLFLYVLFKFQVNLPQRCNVFISRIDLECATSLSKWRHSVKQGAARKEKGAVSSFQLFRRNETESELLANGDTSHMSLGWPPLTKQPPHGLFVQLELIFLLRMWSRKEECLCGNPVISFKVFTERTTERTISGGNNSNMENHLKVYYRFVHSFATFTPLNFRFHDKFQTLDVYHIRATFWWLSCKSVKSRYLISCGHCPQNTIRLSFGFIFLQPNELKFSDYNLIMNRLQSTTLI